MSLNVCAKCGQYYQGVTHACHGVKSDYWTNNKKAVQHPTHTALLINVKEIK